MIVSRIYYEQHLDLIQQLIRLLFLCLTFEGSDNTQALAAQLITMKKELLDAGELPSSDRQLIPAKYQLYVIDADNNIVFKRFEKTLYLAAQISLMVSSLYQHPSNIGHYTIYSIEATFVLTNVGRLT